MSRRIALERPDRVEDEGGGAAVAWAPVATVWAGVASSPQGEAAAHDALVGRISHRLRIRWRADVSPGWRAMLGARTLRIEAAVDRDQKRRWLHLDCTEEIR